MKQSLDLKTSKGIRKELYLNPIARLFLMARQIIKVLIAGRGFGKSFINGITILVKVETLPRSRGLFIGLTYTQILTNTLLPIRAAWEWFEYYERIHYVIGKRPPPHFKEPYHKPERYENVITFWNGTTIILGSFDRPQLLRGGSNDWVIVDEAMLIKKDIYDQVIIPTLRGSHTRLKDKEGHLSEQFSSSMPYGTMGQWLLDYELLAKNPENDVFYIEGTSYHNREVLGEKVLKKWERLPPLTYAVEILNKRIARSGNLFYPSLRERHWYSDSYNYEYIDSLGFNVSDEKKDGRWDKDYDPDLPINISHDWGAFNGITIDQYHRNTNEVRFINVMWVEHPDILDDLANKFCRYYQHHANRVVYQWGDKSGAKREGNAKLTNFEQFATILKANKWRVIRQKIGDIPHLSRHNFINKMHREEDASLPRVRHNMNNCRDLRIALETASMRGDKKDKRSELNASIKQQHATHLTDAYDYRLYHGYFNKQYADAFQSEVSFGLK